MLGFEVTKEEVVDSLTWLGFGVRTDGDLVVTVPTADGKWWVVFREPERAAYAVARTTASFAIGLGSPALG